MSPTTTLVMWNVMNKQDTTFLVTLSGGITPTQPNAPARTLNPGSGAALFDLVGPLKNGAELEILPPPFGPHKRPSDQK